MKYLVVIASLTVATMAQRPSYAGLTPKLGPELHSRFKNPNDTNDDPILANRLGEDTNLPTDARGDSNLVNRLNQWPREHRPFWLINAEHIERHRHPNQQINQNQNTQASQNQNTQTSQDNQFNQFNQQAQPQQTTQLVNLVNRNNFASSSSSNSQNGFFEVVNGIPGQFDKAPDGTVNINFENRFGEPETIPAKPEPPRSSFLGPIKN